MLSWVCSQSVPLKDPTFPGVADWASCAMNKVAFEVSPVTRPSAPEQAQVADQSQYLHGAHYLPAYQLHLES
jgi:hypothetical protein